MRILSNKKAIVLFLAPALIFYTAIVMFPIVQTFFYSLFEWNGIGDKTFTGVDNFQKIINDGVFRKALLNNLIYIVEVMSIQIIVGLTVAILVTYLKKHRDIIKTLYYLPAVLSVIAVAQLFRGIYSYEPMGLLNIIIGWFGFEPIAWLSEYSTALGSVAFIEGWQFIGIYMLIFYSALVSIPESIIEAAQLDGAGTMSLLFQIKLPYIKNVIGLTLILSLVGALRGFAIPLILTRGGPGNQTEILATYLYKKAFGSIMLGYGSAVAVVIIIIAVFGVSIIKRLTKEETF
ncbi:MAG: sugar ABC transporter permease [Anaerolineales bacterium]|nr:sugar ABC transporter permease [Anaerolineales bacterium]